MEKVVFCPGCLTVGLLLDYKITQKPSIIFNIHRVQEKNKPTCFLIYLL